MNTIIVNFVDVGPRKLTWSAALPRPLTFHALFGEVKKRGALMSQDIDFAEDGGIYVGLLRRVGTWGDGMITLTWSDDEQTAIDDIRRTGRFQTEADTIRGALWWYARFLDLDVHPDVFALALPPATRAQAADEQADLFGCEEQEGFLG